MAESDFDAACISGWFAGPKAENGEWFTERIRRIAEDYYGWRRNYFPEDGVVVDSALRRHNEGFMDAFEDRLLELQARLKADVPFQSPRYAAHMLAEQTLPGIAGYIAAMLYNPNNVAADVAPVTVRLEVEAGRLLSRMIGYGQDAWAHLCSGGTTANIEALWMARTVRYLPFVVRDMRAGAGLAQPKWAGDDRAMLGLSPTAAMEAYAQVFREVQGAEGLRRVREVFDRSAFNVAERGVSEVCGRLGSSPVLIVPESHHYCFEKSMDLLGLGRRSLVAVRVDADFRMRVDDLERALDRVEKEGRHVLAVVGVVGSTEEGSVDPLDTIAAMRAAREAAGKGSFWLHADGAYGAYLRTVTIPERIGLGERTTRVRIAGTEREIALALPEHGECDALEAMGRCDSVTIDPHKLGYIPYPAGAVAFKSNLVKPLARQNAPYLEEPPTNPEEDRTSESVGLYVLEGSKPGAAAAAVWLSHSVIPLDSTGHGRLMRENIRNACELHALLERYPGMGDAQGMRAVCLCPPGSNIVCYAFRPDRDGVSIEEINRLNRALFERLSLRAGQRVYDQSFFVSRTSISERQYSVETVGAFLSRLGATAEEYRREGVFLLRSVLMNPWYTHAKRGGRYYISELVEHLYAAVGEIDRGRAG